MVIAIDTITYTLVPYWNEIRTLYRQFYCYVVTSDKYFNVLRKIISMRIFKRIFIAKRNCKCTDENRLFEIR